MKSITIALMFGTAGCLHAADRPNIALIFLIFLDDAAYSDFHPFGKPPYPTPHVEKLASEGVRYTRLDSLLARRSLGDDWAVNGGGLGSFDSQRAALPKASAG